MFGGAVALIWVTAGLYSIAFEVIWKLGDQNQVLYLVVSYFSFFSICLFFIFVSHFSIAIKINCGAHPRHHGAASRENKLTKTLFIMTVVSSMLWLPFVVLLYLFWLGDSSVTSLSLSTYFRLKHAFVFLFYANSLVNPILYTFRIPELKRALVSLLRCRSSPQLFRRTSLLVSCKPQSYTRATITKTTHKERCQCRKKPKQLTRLIEFPSSAYYRYL